uniref:Reverse transcriptase domain-containing protein n=1 Tax=Tanacetum cinerariifolium TaxID=118510 RepID=A0A6L2L713_TANCI|nr:reverse transcriptase domain-containing protein [Tanacetum cinerariifolium]
MHVSVYIRFTRYVSTKSVTGSELIRLRSLVGPNLQALFELDLVLNKVIEMVSCTGKSKPLALLGLLFIGEPSLGSLSISLVAVSGRSGTLVGQDSVTIVSVDVDYLPAEHFDRTGPANRTGPDRLYFCLVLGLGFWTNSVFEMDLFAFIRYSDPTKLMVGKRNVADREAKLLMSTKGRMVLLTPPAPAASGDSGDSIDKLFDEGNGAEQERSTEKGDDVLEETIDTDVLEKTKKKRKKDSSVFQLNLQVCPFVARSSIADAPIVTVVATTTIAADVSTVPPSQVKVVSGRSAYVIEAKKNVASTSKLDEPTTSSDSFYAVQDLDSETLHNIYIYNIYIYIPKWKVTNDSVLDDLATDVSWGIKSEAIEAIRLREQVFALDAADAVKGDELRDLKERNSVLEGEKDLLWFFPIGVIVNVIGSEIRNFPLYPKKDLLSEKVTTLEAVTALKETKVVSLESERGGLVNQISLLESAFELFKQQMEAMQDEQATTLRNWDMKLDAQLLEMAAHHEEEFYPRFLVTISGRWKLIRECNDCQVYRPVLRNTQQNLTPITSPWPFYKWGVDIAGPFSKGPGKVKFLIVAIDYFTKWIETKPVATITGAQDGLKAGVDHRKAGRDLSLIEAYDPSAESKYVNAVNALSVVDFSFLNELESKKDASMVDLMDSLRLEGPLAEIPERKTCNHPRNNSCFSSIG